MHSKLTCDARASASAGAVATSARGVSRSVQLAVFALLIALVTILPACSGGGGDNGASPPRDEITPVGLAFTYPFNGQQDVVLGTQMVVDFADDVSGVGNNALSLVPSDNDAADTLALTVQQDGDQPNILRLTPDRNLAPDTTYNVVATSQISGGNTGFADGDTLFSFKTRPIEGRPADGPLKVVDVSPGDTNPVTGEQSVFTQFNALRVRFSEPVDPASVTRGGSFTFTGPDGAEVPGRLTVLGRYLTFDPANDLEPGDYTVSFTDAVTSQFDKSLVAYSATRTVLSAGNTATENTFADPTSTNLADLPDNNLNGTAANNVNISSQLIGSNDLPSVNADTRGGVLTTLAQPGLSGFGNVFPAVIRGGQKFQLKKLNLKLNGDIQTPILSGPIDVNFANDASVYLMANDYRNIETPTAVRLRFDLAIGTLINAAAGTPENIVQSLANGVFNQTVLNIQAAGLAVPQKNGDLRISTLGTFPINVNRTGNATVDFELTLVLPGGDQPDVKDDVAAPYLTAQSPSACLYVFGSPLYDGAYAQNGASPTVLPEQLCNQILGQEAQAGGRTPPFINSFPVESSPAIVFDEPIDPASINNQSIQLTGGGGGVPVTFQADGTSIVIDPVDPLQPGTTYQIMLNTGAQLTDLAGNAVTFDNSLGPQQTISFTTEPLVQNTEQAPVLLGTLSPGVPCALTGGNYQTGGNTAGHCVGDEDDTPANFPVFQNPANVTPEAIFSQFVDSDSIVLADGCVTAGSGSTNAVANASVAVEQIDGNGQCVGAVPGKFALANHGDPVTRAFAFRPTSDFVPGTRYWIVICGSEGSSCANTIVGSDAGQPLNTDPLTGTGSTPAPMNANTTPQGGPDIIMPFDAVQPTQDFYGSQFTLPHTDTNGNGQFDQDEGELPQPGNRTLVALSASLDPAALLGLGDDPLTAATTPLLQNLGGLLQQQAGTGGSDPLALQVPGPAPDGSFPSYLSLARPIAIRGTLDDCSVTNTITNADGGSAIGATPDQCIEVSLLPGGVSALTSINIGTDALVATLTGGLTDTLTAPLTSLLGVNSVLTQLQMAGANVDTLVSDLPQPLQDAVTELAASVPDTGTGGTVLDPATATVGDVVDLLSGGTAPSGGSGGSGSGTPTLDPNAVLAQTPLAGLLQPLVPMGGTLQGLLNGVTDPATLIDQLANGLGGELTSLVPGLAQGAAPIQTGRVLLRFPNDTTNDAAQTGYIVQKCTGTLNGQTYDYEPCLAASLTLVANAPDGQGVTLPQQQITANVVGPVTFEQNGRIVISTRNVNTFTLTANALGLLPTTATVDPGDLNFQLTGNAAHGGRAFPVR